MKQQPEAQQNAITIDIGNSPASTSPFRGLGMQTDCYIYDDVNRQFGVNDADYARWERRLGLLRPGLARVFLPTNEFNPSGDGKTYDWNTKEMQWQLRNLAVLKAAGAQVNLCMGPWTNQALFETGGERLAVDLVEHLVRERGCDHIRWLSLFNEPDHFYSTGSDLNRELVARGFGEDRPLADYVEKHLRTLALLEDRGLAGRVKLVVGDMAWPPARRQEWLERLVVAFAGRKVCYSFHHYAPDETQYDAFFTHPQAVMFRPPPLAQEIRRYRETVGADAELICWEFGLSAWGMGVATSGVGLHGEDHVGTFATAINHAKKVLTLLGEGVEGMSHWCVGDMFYRSGLAQGVMYFGLWRYKWEAWAPRPVYFYYAALLEAIRPGCRLHRVEGLPESAAGLLACDASGRQTLVLLNHGRETATFDVSLSGLDRRLRVSPERLPCRPDAPVHETGAEEEPLCHWQPLSQTGGRICLEPGELTLLSGAGQGEGKVRSSAPSGTSPMAG